MESAPSNDHHKRTTDIIFDTNHFVQVDALTGTRPMFDLPPPGENRIIDAALSGQTSGVVSDHSGKKWIYATQHLERVGWMFLRAIPYEQATQPARAAFNSFLSASALAVLVIAALAWLLALATTRPLEKISLRIGEMATEGFAAKRLSLQGPPEIRNLARAFNKLMKEREALDTPPEERFDHLTRKLVSATHLLVTGRRGPAIHAFPHRPSISSACSQAVRSISLTT